MIRWLARESVQHKVEPGAVRLEGGVATDAAAVGGPATQLPQLTNDPLAAIPSIATSHVYAVTRVNPLYKDEPAHEEKEDRLSPRKSISSGYESRCNSSSESSCECDSEASLKQNKRRNDKKKKTKYEAVAIQDDGRRRTKNGSNSGLSPIPEGRVDVVLPPPPPVWPRPEPDSLPHDGTTNPLNFVFKLGEVPSPLRCRPDHPASLPDPVVSSNEYERSWEECSRYQFVRSRSLPLTGEGGQDSGQGSTPEGTMERTPPQPTELTHEILRDLANLISVTMHNRTSLTVDDVLNTLSESIHKSLDILTRTECDESLRRLCETLRRSVASSAPARDRKRSVRSVHGEFILYSSTNETCSTSTRSSKELYTSSSSASKDGLCSSNSSSIRERQKIYHRKKTEDVSKARHQRDSSTSSADSSLAFSESDSPGPNVLNPVFTHEGVYTMPNSVRNAILYTDSAVLSNCGSSAFEKLISAKRKISSEVLTEKPVLMAPPTVIPKVDSGLLKKVEHPYYIAMGRPDFTLDLPEAEQLMKKIASSKRRRCWCRLITSLLGLVFFMVSVMLVSLVVTNGRKMFGAI